MLWIKLKKCFKLKLIFGSKYFLDRLDVTSYNFFKNSTNTNKQLNIRHFFTYIKFFIYTYVMSAAKGIEPIAVRLRAQRQAAEPPESVNQIYFFFLGATGALNACSTSKLQKCCCNDVSKRSFTRY